MQRYKNPSVIALPDINLLDIILSVTILPEPSSPVFMSCELRPVVVTAPSWPPLSMFFNSIHRSGGGLRSLVGTGFILPLAGKYAFLDDNKTCVNWAESWTNSLNVCVTFLIIFTLHPLCQSSGHWSVVTSQWPRIRPGGHYWLVFSNMGIWLHSTLF